ncbi:NmrA family NAD(P)-binding protein [Cesiribacter sp. SM1]|uniref:NmrA family NAD(P)-binding protein n=1 Tax=Cesiribacter sp. SM1 TaxID=2861196 RepID=UPI001CD60938|nr:NmrA family NAD(P)-binding protein [Cesiribacter sp. SM1]
MAVNRHNNQNNNTIILAGATGALGGKIARSLLKRGANVRAIVRPGSNRKKVEGLQELGISIVEADYNSHASLTRACTGGDCVVSALSGLREVIVEVQTALLEAAIAAGVPRFIPSDYAIDFTKIPFGTNRNLDLRKEFKERLDQAPVKATSVLNGMFTDLLTGDAPVVLFPLQRIMYWGNAEQPMDFTTMDNTAEYTAAAALDPSTPRFLHIAGDVQSARGLKLAAGTATRKKFELLRIGGLGTLRSMINLTRFVYPGNGEVFPPWQGMQYLHNMLSGLPKLQPLDNDRYPCIRWTSVQEVLSRR